MAELYNSQLVWKTPQFMFSSRLTFCQDAFSLYHKIQESSEPSSLPGGPALPALGHAVAGSTGAAISNILTYPLDLIITRLQIQRQLRKDSSTPSAAEYQSIQDAAQKIHSKEGLAGFYSGVVQDTSKTIADSFLFFLAYNYLRQSRLRSRNLSSSHLPVFDELSVGFLAGAFAKFFTTPISNIVTRKQTASMLSERSTARRNSVGSIASQIHSEKGLRGFWSGYSASLVLTLNPSLTFLFYETLKRTILPRSQRSDPPAQATFLLAAVSKALASSITYPFSLAKTRAQVSSKTVDDDDAEVKESVEKVTAGQTSGTRRGGRAARGTVFGTILHIARTEGLSALYEGLAGEVLKGFFSHGITMIVKESVHKMIIQLYYAILKLMKRYPNPSQMADMAKAQAQQSAQAVKGGVQRLADEGSSKMTQAYEATASQAQQSAESLKSSVNAARNKGQEAARQGSERVSEAYENTKGAAFPIGKSIKSSTDSAMTSVAESGKATYESGKDVTGNLTTNANEAAAKVADYIGEKTENLGSAIRPDKGSDKTK